MITCPVAEDLLERRLDEETTARDERALSEHLAGCEACSGLRDREAAIDAALAAHFAGAAPTPRFERRVLARIRTEHSVEQLGWMADALNAVGGVAMVALSMWGMGLGRPATALGLLAGVAAAGIGLYPLLLARWESEDLETANGAFVSSIDSGGT